MEDIEKQSTPLTYSETTLRHAFIKKVMGIVLLLLIVTFFVALSPLIFNINFPINKGLLLSLAFIHFIVGCVFALADNIKRNYPLNIILVFSYAFLTGVILLHIILFVKNKEIVWIALLFTIISCGILILFAFQTKYDFTKWLGVLTYALIILFVLSIISLIISFFVKIKIISLIISLVSCMLFMMFLVLDMQMVIGGGRYEYSQEDYIDAAISIYLNIITIYIEILRILNYSDE